MDRHALNFIQGGGEVEREREIEHDGLGAKTHGSGG